MKNYVILLWLNAYKVFVEILQDNTVSKTKWQGRQAKKTGSKNNLTRSSTDLISQLRFQIKFSFQLSDHFGILS